MVPLMSIDNEFWRTGDAILRLHSDTGFSQVCSTGYNASISFPISNVSSILQHLLHHVDGIKCHLNARLISHKCRANIIWHS